MPLIEGPDFQDAMRTLSSTWKQGEHIGIFGGTGSGKTTLARRIAGIRTARGGAHIVFAFKPFQDETLEKDYAGYVRWDKKYKTSPSVYEDRVLLWPKVGRDSPPEYLDRQKTVFKDAVGHIYRTGKWCVQIDDANYFSSNKFVGMDKELGMLHMMGRAGKLTMITLGQRPAFLDKSLYDSFSHVFVAQTRERDDATRLSALGGSSSSFERHNALSNLGRFDYLWIPRATGGNDRIINVTR